jgi:Tfp pilus assembly pilus retraction ATPase PilT
VARILGTAPKERVDEIRSDLANHLAAILAQRLVRGRKGEVHAAFELLLPTTAVRALLAEGSDKHLPNELESRDSGMISMDRSLAALVKRNLVDREEALRVAVDRTAAAKWLAA